MNFILRKWRLEDAADLAGNINNPKVERNLRDGLPMPYTTPDAEAYIKDCLEADPALRYLRAIEVDGVAAGSIGVFTLDNVYRKSAEIGYYLGEPYWGRGIMTSVVGTACREAFAALDIVRIHAGVYAGNAGSRRVLEKNGFVLEGVQRSSVWKHGVLMDSCIYALLR